MKSKKNILLVEDDSFVRNIYDTKLKSEGFEVFLAENGKEALEEMEKNTPDFILLDIAMPYMDGIDVLKLVRQKDEWKKIPIIMLTNLSEREKIEEALAIGADDYLIKSHFTPSEVVAKINAIMKK